jgi:hypothetical protein
MICEVMGSTQGVGSRSPAELSRSMLASGERCQGLSCGCARLSAWFVYPQDLGCGESEREREEMSGE